MKEQMFPAYQKENLEIKNEEELEEAKKMAGVTTHKEARGRFKEVDNGKNNAQFANIFNNFGIKDPEMLNKLMGYGKIATIENSDDSLKIFYKIGKQEEIKAVAVRKSEVKKIDPQSNAVTETQTHFIIDTDPGKNHGKMAKGRKPNQEQYERDSGSRG